MDDEASQQPLSRKVPIPSSQINPYRIMIIIRIAVLGFFLHYRISHPVSNAHALWLVSIVCEMWFAMSWILDQFQKWQPVDRETYLHRLSSRHEKQGQLSPVDILVISMQEPPLVTANTVLSTLAVDYPVEKVSCYISDDGASILTFETLSKTSEFARKWVPFCKKFKIEPRAPESYFSKKIDYLEGKVLASFVRERRAMKREYEEFKVEINALAAKAKKVPGEGWIMQDGTPWPGNNARDHPGMIQVLIGHGIGQGDDQNKLPGLVYVSREKRQGFKHHNKAGALNALARVSAVMTNAPYILHLDCDHYINNSKVLKETMCFMMDPRAGQKVCYVQFPQTVHRRDPCPHTNIAFDINMKGLDGIQGPIYVGTGSVLRRLAVHGYHAPKQKKALRGSCNSCFEWNCFARKRTSDFRRLGWKLDVGEHDHGDKKSSSLVKEAIHVVSCEYEDKTDWGKEVGWIYSSTTNEILTGFKMHCRGWRSIYCVPSTPAFKCSTPINLSGCLHLESHWALGSMEILLSKLSPLWQGYGGELNCLQHLFYVNATVYPLTSIPLVVYCTLPAVCLLTGKSIIPELNNVASMWFVSLIICVFATTLLEMKWSGVGVEDWWRSEQFWVMGSVSSHLLAVFHGFIKVVAGVDANNFVATPTTIGEDEFLQSWPIKRATLLVPPTTLLMVNLIGIVIGISNEIRKGSTSWGLVVGKVLFALWVIVHLYPFLKALYWRNEIGTPMVVVIWSILIASMLSLVWIHNDPFVAKSNGPILEECGLDCSW